MARRVGSAQMPMASVEDILFKERQANRDEYLPLVHLQPQIRDSLAPLPARFAFRCAGERSTFTAVPTMNSLSQYCNLMGMPIQFLEKIPANMAVRMFSVLLDTCPRADGRQFLVRLNETDGTRLRAILAHSFVRFDDRQVVRVLNQVSAGNFTVKTVEVDEDQMHLRLLLPRAIAEPLDLGTATRRDPALSGLDLVTSETGAGPMELRQLVYREICSNGLTVLTGGERIMKRRYTEIDRGVFEGILQKAINQAATQGPETAARLAATRAQPISDSQRELETAFRTFRLGSPNGRLGRLVREELEQSTDLFGVQRFDFIQAFTAVARGLESRDRLRVEDAMGEYLVRGMGRN
jgi:hypothetical protein